MSSKGLIVIVAATKINGIGVNGRLPWRLPGDMAFFARITSNAPEGHTNAVIMGRKTWESIPLKFRPLPKRVNLVISRNCDYDLGNRRDSGSAQLESSLQGAIQRLGNSSETLPVHRRFVIGGADIYSKAFSISKLEPEHVDRVLLTRVSSPDFNECNVFLPDFADDDPTWRRAGHDELRDWAGFDVPEGAQHENGIKYEFQMWVR